MRQTFSLHRQKHYVIHSITHLSLLLLVCLTNDFHSVFQLCVTVELQRVMNIMELGEN